MELPVLNRVRAALPLDGQRRTEDRLSAARRATLEPLFSIIIPETWGRRAEVPT